MNYKSFSLTSVNEEGAHVYIAVRINKKGEVNQPVFGFTSTKQKRQIKKKSRVKESIRQKDRDWVYRNIPSSIWWGSELHHDWKNEGFLFLVSPEEHRKITRREVKERYD